LLYFVQWVHTVTIVVRFRPSSPLCRAHPVELAAWDLRIRGAGKIYHHSLWVQGMTFSGW
jgi:hypothetical protein